MSAKCTLRALAVLAHACPHSPPKPRESGVERSVSYSGPGGYSHHDYPFLVPFAGAASKSAVLPSFCTSHDRCKAIYRCAIHAEPYFAEAMPILQPASLTVFLRRQRARSCSSQCAPETSCVMSPSSCQRIYVYVKCDQPYPPSTRMGRVNLTYIAHGNKRKACDVLRIIEGCERGRMLRAVQAAGEALDYRRQRF